jgi:hypothetical protein
MTGEGYDPQKDLMRGLAACYRAIRERRAAGGPGWAPGAPKEKGGTEAPPSPENRTSGDL